MHYWPPCGNTIPRGPPFLFAFRERIIAPVNPAEELFSSIGIDLLRGREEASSANGKWPNQMDIPGVVANGQISQTIG
jgi:hypothetical protein